MGLYIQVHRQARGLVHTGPQTGPWACIYRHTAREPGQTQVYCVGSCRLQRAASPRLRASLSGTSPKLCQNWVFYATLYLHAGGGRSISIQSNEKCHLADSFRRPLTQPVVQWRMDVINQYLDFARIYNMRAQFLIFSPPPPPPPHTHTYTPFCFSFFSQWLLDTGLNAEIINSKSYTDHIQ